MFKRSASLATVSLALLGAAAALSAGPAPAAGGAGAGAEVSMATAKVGEFTLNMTAPEGMSPVMGLCPAGDEFLYLMNERFKLVVLAAYADPAEYQEFCRAMERGEYRPVPNIALVSVPRKMHERSYDGKGTAKELKRYVSWFTLATNTRLIALAFESKANKALKKKLGRDLDFSYKLGELTGVFHRTPSSLGVGVLFSVKLGGGRSDNYIAAAVYQMGDKLVFLSMEGLDRSPAGVEALRAELIRWGDGMAARNEPPLGTLEAKSGGGEAPPSGGSR
ncbi:MAG: hypothetical protein LBG06_06085 [Deltaproteobacteria bacterium]|jgi:hypothetical protein|nr:hypothetical protein [Deltaproteobacteria bacterium]